MFLDLLIEFICHRSLDNDGQRATAFNNDLSVSKDCTFLPN